MILLKSLKASIVLLLVAPNPTIDSTWLGTWEHSVRWKHLSGDHYDFENYNLILSNGQAGLEAILTADGRMLMIRAKLKPVVTANGVKLYFAESSEPGMPTFSPNELLLELIRQKGKILTVWHGLRPTNSRKSGLYFKKQPTPSGHA